MRSRRISAAIAILTAANALRMTPVAHAGPIIIRDEMISDHGISPSIGRGYSIATNTFQSICLKGVKKTTPSYDFTYSFEEVAPTGATVPDLTVAGTQGSFTSITIPEGETTSFDKDPNGKVIPKFKQFIKIAISIDLYYHSLDDMKDGGGLGEAAASLLTDKDIPGFFDACGVYYTRTINRRASYLSLFSYETETNVRDKAFERALKEQITGFGSSIAPPQLAITPKPIQATPQRTSPPPPSSADAERARAQGASGGALNSQQSDSAAIQEATFQSKKLTIRSFGFGMGKPKTPTPVTPEEPGLLAYDLITFKAAAKAAFKLMQGDDAGTVTSIEVVPWVENPFFQALFELPTGDIEDPTRRAPAEGQAAASKIRVSPYTQKRILSQNSEFLAEIDRASRSRLLNYYRAKMCKMHIERNYAAKASSGGGAGGAAAAGPVPLDQLKSELKLLNLRTRKPTDDAPSLSSLYTTELSDDKIAALYKDFDDFTYTAAQRCLDVLLGPSFSLTVYRKIVPCQGLEQSFAVVAGQKIEDYCTPSFAPATAASTAAKPAVK